MKKSSDFDSALKIHIFGKVQGVFFRASAKSVADSLNLQGFVANQPDGSVIVVVNGEGGSLNEFVNWCQIGPPNAKISNINIIQLSQSEYHRLVSSQITSFDIKMD